MQPSSPIYFLDRPFANEGDKTIIPAEEASADGRATLSEGFPEVTQLPIASGGIPPSRWDFNGMFFLLSQLAHWEQSGGIMTWNSELGYTPPCLVYYNKIYYVGVTESGPETDAGAVTPGTDTNYWETLWNYLSSGQTFVTAGNTVTLTGNTTGEGTFDSSGNVSVETTTSTAATATKLGSSTVGGPTQFFYLSNGSPVATTKTIGAADTPIYQNAGVLTACDSIGVPVGTVIMYYGSSAPDGYLICNGGTFSKSTYPELYSVLGSTTLPDLRDQFIRGVSSSRSAGSTQTDMGRSLTATWRSAYEAAQASTGMTCTGAITTTLCSGNPMEIDGCGYKKYFLRTFDASTVWGSSHTGSEFRPVNTALLFCIKHD